MGKGRNRLGVEAPVSKLARLEKKLRALQAGMVGATGLGGGLEVCEVQAALALRLGFPRELQRPHLLLEVWGGQGVAKGGLAACPRASPARETSLTTLPPGGGRVKRRRLGHPQAFGRRSLVGRREGACGRIGRACGSAEIRWSGNGAVDRSGDGAPGGGAGQSAGTQARWRQDQVGPRPSGRVLGRAAGLAAERLAALARKLDSDLA